MWREKTKWFAAAAALFVAAAAVPYGSYYFYNWQLSQEASTQAKIQRVQSEAQQLDTAWSTIEQKGGPDRQRISNMDSIVAYRNLSTDIILDIYNQLPQNDPSAPAALKGNDLAALKAIPRSQRKQVFVQKVGLRYASDVSSILSNPSTLGNYADDNVAIVAVSPDQTGMPGGMGMGGVGGQPPDQGGGMGAPPPPVPTGPAGGQRAFIVTVKCTTPDATGVVLVEQGFMAKLTALKLPTLPDKPYVFKQSMVHTDLQLANDTAWVQKMTADFQRKTSATGAAGAGMSPMNGGMMGGAAGGGFIGGMAGGATGAMVAPNPNDAFVDPSTQEDMRSDTEVTFVLLVLIDPPPPAPAVKPAGT
jgi:hypothetical protein